MIGDSSSSPILVYDCGLAGPRIVQLAAGSHHSMALTSDGGVVAWGSNLEGQLGLPENSGLVYKPMKIPIPEPVKEISAGYYHSVFLTGNGCLMITLIFTRYNKLYNSLNCVRANKQKRYETLYVFFSTKYLFYTRLVQKKEK